MNTEIILLNRFNWENYLSIEITQSQKEFCPSVLYSLAQAFFENAFAYGINHQGSPAGFILCLESSNFYWISRFMIDFRFQNKGIGKAALWILLRQINQKSGGKEVRTSFNPQNLPAYNLFSNAGFIPLNTTLGEETVAIWNQRFLE